jgi:hypothetical protein
MTWMLTHTGQAFDLGRPKPSQVCIEDVAHHLSLINRFTGATSRPYSVAEHSLLVVEILERDGGVRDAMCLRAALLHDAHEAIVGDVATPVKEFLGDGWHVLERSVQIAVQQHFGIERAAREHRFTIKYADLRALATERRDLMPKHDADWPILKGFDPVGWIDLREREGMDWDDWKLAFLCKHAELSHRCEAAA